MSRRLSLVLVFLIPLIVYSPTLLGKFYYDDNVIFFGHQVKVLAENPLGVFKGQMHYLPGAPRSIHVFFLLMIYKAFGTAPFPYHLFNLLLHCATTLLVFIFLRGITEQANENSDVKQAVPLTLGALVFGLHPVHLENITFVTLGGTDLFYTFWAMLSLVLYMRFRHSASKARFAMLVLSAVTFYFSLLSKESAVVFILIYPLTDLLFVRRGRKVWSPGAVASCLWALPHAVLLAVYKKGFIFGAVSSAVSVVGQAASKGGGPAGIEEIFKSLGFFMKSLFFPYPHLPFIKEFGNETVLYSFAVFTGMFLIVSIVFKKRLLIYSALWFLIVSLPYHFVPLTQANVAITAERYIYGPSIGLGILVIGAVGAIRPFSIRIFSYLPFLSRRGPDFLFRSAVAVLLVVYSVLGVGYFFKVWRTEETFWRYAVKTNPDYVSGYVSLASIELERGDVRKARSLLIEGLGKSKGMPAEFAQAAYTMGNIAKHKGNLRKAESYYLLSLKYSPYEFSYINLGFLYLHTGDIQGAKWAFEGAMRFPQQNVRAVYGLAKTYSLLGEKEKARRYATMAYKRARNERLRALAAEILNSER